MSTCGLSFQSKETSQSKNEHQKATKGAKVWKATKGAKVWKATKAKVFELIIS